MCRSMSRRTSFGARGARNQHGADHDVGTEHFGLDDLHGRSQRANAALEQLVELPEARKRLVDDGDIRAEADGHARRMRADNAAAEHDDLRRAHARHAAQEHAAPARRAAQRDRGSFDRQAAGDLAHRSEQGKTAGGIGHGLVGDRGGAGRHQPARLLRIGSEMKIGEENLVRLEPPVLDRLRLLDLDDHLGVREHRFRRRQNAGACFHIRVVVGEDARACTRLHDDLVPARRKLADRARDETDSELIALDFCRNADAHDALHEKGPAALEMESARRREKIVGNLFAV